MIEQIIERISEVFNNRFGYELRVHPNNYIDEWGLTVDNQKRLALVKHSYCEKWGYSVNGHQNQICFVEVIDLKSPSIELQKEMALELATNLEVFLQKIEYKQNRRIRQQTVHEAKHKKIVSLQEYQTLSVMFDQIGPIPRVLKSKEVPHHMLLIESKPLDAYRIAHEIHQLSRRWAFLTVDRDFFKEHNYDSIQDMGAVTLFIEDFSQFTQEEQEHLDKIIEWQPTADQPVVIAAFQTEDKSAPVYNSLHPKITEKLRLHSVENHKHLPKKQKNWKVAQEMAKSILGLDQLQAKAVGDSQVYEKAPHLSVVDHAPIH